MDVHASLDSLAEFQEFLRCLQVRFRRAEGRAALERYATGLLTELPDENWATMAQAVPGTRVPLTAPSDRGRISDGPFPQPRCPPGIPRSGRKDLGRCVLMR